MRKSELLQGLTLAAAAGFLLAGCNDDVVYVEDGPPAVPTGVYTVTGDRSVDVIWNPVRENDVAGYGVYRSDTLDGAYERLATLRGVENTSYTDYEVANGVTYYYAVDAFDERGHESDLSYEAAFDTPRPAGYGITVQADVVDPNHAGVDLSAWRTSGFVLPWNAANTDVYVHRIGSVLYLKGTAIGGNWNDIQDLGYTSSLDEISWAPADGWSVSPNGVELIKNHTYVVWTHDSYFAKLRVTDILQTAGVPSAIVFDWAYQVDQGNQELAPPARVAAGDEPGGAKEDMS